MSEPVHGRIVNYRIGIKTQISRECLIQFNHVNSISEASQLIGRKVVLKEGKKKFIGKIVGLHGKKGLIRARFRKGVPGQSLGTSVKLIGRLKRTLVLKKEGKKENEKTESAISVNEPKMPKR